MTRRFLAVHRPALLRRTEARMQPPHLTTSGAWFDRHDHVTRALALLALGWDAFYLTWRVGGSWHGVDPLLWALLLLVDLYGMVGLGLLTWFSWTRRDPVRPPLEGVEATVDVYVCTYNEPDAVLRATLIGCAAMTYPHRTYLLDDGRRPQMRDLAAELGATWITRPDNSHAKAGNINHALPLTTGDLVLVLDADHVPMPEALDALVGYFHDDRLALVQTPHDFYNHDSSQHYTVGRHEQSVFFEVVLPGKDRHGGAFWCGSATLLRRRALLDIGGVATETIAEDFHTTIRLQENGWRTRYHGEVLVQGLAPHDLAAYLLQRDRWARGNIAVLHTPESPLTASGLTFVQRLSYAASLFGYGGGPIRLVLLFVLAATCWTGQLPMTADLRALVLLWAPATLFTALASLAVSRGRSRLRDSVHYELLTAEIYVRALRAIFKAPKSRFRVTPKDGGDDGGWQSLRHLRLVLALTVLLATGLVFRLLEDAGVSRFGTLGPPMDSIAAVVVPVFAVLELSRLIRTILLVWGHRQRRTQSRFPCYEPARVSIDGASSVGGWVRNISLGGINLELPRQVSPGTRLAARLTLDRVHGGSADVVVSGVARHTVPSVGGQWHTGVQLETAPAALPRALWVFCFIVCARRRLRLDAGPAPAVVPVSAPPLPAWAAPAPAPRPAEPGYGTPQRLRAVARAVPAWVRLPDRADLARALSPIRVPVFAGTAPAPVLAAPADLSGLPRQRRRPDLDRAPASPDPASPDRAAADRAAADRASADRADERAVVG